MKTSHPSDYADYTDFLEKQCTAQTAQRRNLRNLRNLWMVPPSILLHELTRLQRAKRETTFCTAPLNQ